MTWPSLVLSFQPAALKQAIVSADDFKLGLLKGKGKHKKSLATFENFSLISFSNIQPEDFTPGKVAGTTMNNFHTFVSLLLLPSVPFVHGNGCRWPLSWREGICAACALSHERQRWPQQVIPLFRLLPQTSGLLTLGCRRARNQKSQFQMLFKWPWLLGTDGCVCVSMRNQVSLHFPCLPPNP